METNKEKVMSEMSKQIVNAHPILKANLSTIPQSIVKSKNLPKSSTTKKRVSHTIQVSDEFYSKTLTSQNYTLETALSELIDNSIDAKAKDIIINYPKKSTFDIKKSTITIFDNGNVGINTITIGSKLQVNGNTAIGYSASTAAPAWPAQISFWVVFLRAPLFPVVQSFY